MTHFSGPLEDRLLVRERFGAYSDSVFQNDVNAWLSHWTDDGLWLLANNKEIRGKAALKAQWEKLWSSLRKVMFFTEIGRIEIDGDHAKTRSYCREILYFHDGSMQKVVGMYTDELIRTQATWLFARRNYQLIADEKKT